LGPDGIARDREISKEGRDSMNWWTKTREFFAAIPRFFREVKSEMSKVSFPSRDEVVGTTVVVLVASFVFAIYLWVADLVIVQLFKVIGS
jgi:preprotein translocase subunit SecE